MAPRAALAEAADPDQPGRAGTDLILLLGAIVVAVHLRALFAAAWLAVRIDASAGARAGMLVISRSFTADLAFLLIGAGVVFAAAGARRSLGRAFDRACVALVPVVLVEAAAFIVVRGAGVAAPGWLGAAVTLAADAWGGVILALAIAQERGRATATPGPTRAGWGIAGALALVLGWNAIWIAGHSDVLRPLDAGDDAPELALPRIGAGGALGPPLALSSLRGKVVVLEFWATWCHPCLDAMPGLAALARKDAGRGLEVVAIDLDDAEAARAMFDAPEHRWPMTLVFDPGGAASDRYGVGPIPHTVVLDRDGRIAGVFRGDPEGAARLADSLLP